MARSTASGRSSEDFTTPDEVGLGPSTSQCAIAPDATYGFSTRGRHQNWRRRCARSCARAALPCRAARAGGAGSARRAPRLAHGARSHDHPGSVRICTPVSRHRFGSISTSITTARSRLRKGSCARSRFRSAEELAGNAEVESRVIPPCYAGDANGVIAWSYLSPDAVNPGADGILSALEALAGDRS